jgi:DNA-directed RNA polymerase subunit RPC12/RpoP
MEIIVRGKAPAEYRYDGTCSTCKSVLKADHDLHHTFDQRDGEMSVATCPVCTSRVWFYKERS